MADEVVVLPTPPLPPNNSSLAMIVAQNARSLNSTDSSQFLHRFDELIHTRPDNGFRLVVVPDFKCIRPSRHDSWMAWSYDEIFWIL